VSNCPVSIYLLTLVILFRGNSELISGWSIMSYKNSEEQHLEFGGAVGVTFLVFSLPATVVVINVACNKVFTTPHVCNQQCLYMSICLTICLHYKLAGSYLLN